MNCAFSTADRALAARLEAAEAGNVLAMAAWATASIPDAAFEEFADGTAAFAGVGSPMTHALGIGMHGVIAAEEMERMEALLRDRGSPCLIDLCPLADPSVIAYVQSRPYRSVEFNNVLARRIEPAEEFASASGVRLISESETPQWARLISQGFAEYMPVSDDMVAMMTTPCKTAQCWFAANPLPKPEPVWACKTAWRCSPAMRP